MRSTCIWVTGAAGGVGKVLIKKLKANQDYKVIGTDTDVDVTDLSAVEHAMAIYRPTVVINCAGISDADYCEQHRLEAYRVNALGARNVAAASQKINARIIHLSTDDVFCGEHDHPKNEFDVPTPNTVYGMSKLAGENFIRELNPKHLIVRSSWVYGVGRNDFLHHVLSCGKAGTEFTAPLDCISAPTSVSALADFIVAVMDSGEYGIYHAACEGVCSRHQYAQTALSLMGMDPSLAKGTFSRDAANARTSTVLENLMMKMTGIYEMPEWQKEMGAYIAQHREVL